MDHQQQHHEHHRKEREEEKRHEHEREAQTEKNAPIIHPYWFVALGVVLTVTAVVIWIVVSGAFWAR